MVRKNFFKNHLKKLAKTRKMGYFVIFSNKLFVKKSLVGKV